MKRAGFTLIEVAVVALIAGGAMIFILSLGQANVQMSRVNQESMLARQIATDVLDYYAHNLSDAKRQAAPQPQPGDFYLRHAAFRGAFGLSEQTDGLYLRMNPEITFQLEPNVEFPAGSGRRNPGLHRLLCKVGWTAGGNKAKADSLVMSRLVGEIK